MLISVPQPYRTSMTAGNRMVKLPKNKTAEFRAFAAQFLTTEVQRHGENHRDHIAES